MIRKFVASAGLALALFGHPVLAQEEVPEAAMAEAFGEMAAMFDVEPLTPEQEARLPLARQIMDRMMPPGMMVEVFDSMMGGMLGPLLEGSGISADTALLEATGYTQSDLGISDQEAEQALSIIDPAWRERQEATNAYSQIMGREIMAAVEPLMRDAMAEVYAVHFTEGQLRDIDAFFATESGVAFARQSVTLMSDPRLMAALFSDPDVFMGSIMGGIAGMEEAMAGIPAMRSYDDLSDREKASVRALLGLSEEDLSWTVGDDRQEVDAFEGK